MNLKFLRIGVANAEIERLTAETAALTKERDELKAAFEANTSETAKAAEELQAQATTAKEEARIATEQLAKATTDLATIQAELAEAKAKLANPPAQIASIASQKAAEITAAQGQPAIAVDPPGTLGGAASGSADELLEQMGNITDPNKRTEFFRKNRAALMAAFRATK